MKLDGPAKLWRLGYDLLLFHGVNDRLLIRHQFFWARRVLRRHRPRIIGVTGTAGKSTTVETVATMLANPAIQPAAGTVWWTRDNLNAQSGFPRIILGIPGDWPDGIFDRLVYLGRTAAYGVRRLLARDYPRNLVLEYATREPGWIPPMVGLAPPDIAVITTVGPAHLEFFGAIEAIVDEKAALVRGMNPAGLVLLGEDHPYVGRIERQAAASRIVRLPGRGPELSRRIAKCIALELGIGEEAAEKALEQVTALKGRLNRIELPDFTILDDSYNANPLSMRLGLDTLSEAAAGRRRVAILGWMAELGGAEGEYHAEIGRHARVRADVVVGVGELSHGYAPDHWFPDSAACALAIGEILRPGDCILLKGSHASGLSQVVESLKRGAPPITGSRTS